MAPPGRSFGGALTDGGSAVAADSLGNVVAAGHFEHSIDFGCAEPLQAVGDSDFFVVKLAPQPQSGAA